MFVIEWIWSEHTKRKIHKKNPLCREGRWTLAQVAWRDCGFSIHADFQNPLGHRPALGALLEQGIGFGKDWEHSHFSADWSMGDPNFYYRKVLIFPDEEKFHRELG